MKILQELEAVLISTKKEEYKKKDGTGGVLYSVSIDAAGECGTLNCTEEVYVACQSLEKYKNVCFVTSFDSFYKNYRIIRAYAID